MVRFAENRDLAINFRGLRHRVSVRSPVQRINLFEHPKLGKILVLGGEVHHVEKWQCLYHEPLIHVPCAFIPKVRNALILGGGSLFAAAEILKYPTIGRCTLVDHDPLVLKIMTRHYSHAAAVMNDQRFHYIASDAISFLETTDDKYDLVVNDGYDTVRATKESGRSVFGLMTKHRSAYGVCADVIYRNILDRGYMAATRLGLRSAKSAFSLITVPEYPGVLHMLACWGGDTISQRLRTPINHCQKKWIARKSLMPNLQFYNPRFLSFYLYLPPYLSTVDAFPHFINVRRNERSSEGAVRSS
jgi:spermidine synthase